MQSPYSHSSQEAEEEGREGRMNGPMNAYLFQRFHDSGWRRQPNAMFAWYPEP
jgi:hypothetical protein